MEWLRDGRCMSYMRFGSTPQDKAEPIAPTGSNKRRLSPATPHSFLHFTQQEITMKAPASRSISFLRQARTFVASSKPPARFRASIAPRCPACRHLSQSSRRAKLQSVDDPTWKSIVDNPPELVRAGRRHGPGLIILGILFCVLGLTRLTANWDAAIIPLTAFALGTWQVKRLDWKSKLIAKFEDRLVRDPLPLPPHVDPEAVKDFDFRRIYATGHFRHDQEMLIGPRIHEGTNGYLVVTPLEREGDGTTVLVNRGWISKKFQKQADRPDGLPKGEITVEGLLRQPWKKNMFTPDNRPETNDFHFPDVEQMAKLTGSQAVWIEQTMG